MRTDPELETNLRRLGEVIAPSDGFADRVAAGVASLPRPTPRRTRRVLVRAALAAAVVLMAVSLPFFEARRMRLANDPVAVADAGLATDHEEKPGAEPTGPRPPAINDFSQRFQDGKAPPPRQPAPFFSMTAIAYVNSKWGFIDRTGKTIIPARYSAVGEFSEGLAPVKVGGTHFLGGKWGFVDRSGQEVIPPQFIGALPFHEGLAGVSDGEKWGFIDRSGRIVIPPRFETVHWFAEGLAAVREDGKWGFIGTDGQYRILAQFGYVNGFSEGLAVVHTTTKPGETAKYGYVDPSGRYVIEPRFDSAAAFHEGRAAVVAGAVRGLIDRTGAVVFEAKYDSFSQVTIGELKNGRARVHLTKRLAGGKNNGLSVDWFAYIDPDGREIVPPKPWIKLTIDPATGALAARDVDDQGDETAVAVDLDRARDEDGLFRVWVSHRAGNVGYHTCGFADRSRRVVIPPTLEDVKELHEGLAAFATGLDWKAVDEAFKN